MPYQMDLIWVAEMLLRISGNNSRQVEVEVCSLKLLVGFSIVHCTTYSLFATLFKFTNNQSGCGMIHKFRQRNRTFNFITFILYYVGN